MAEIHTFVSDIVENRLIAVALILHITDFHLQPQVHSNFARAYHGVLFAGLGLLIAFHVGRLGLAEDAQYLGILAQVHTSHLVLDQASCEPHATDVVARVGLNSHPIALFQGDVGTVAVETAPRVLEEHLNDVEIVVGHIVKPIGAGEVATADIGVTTAGTAMALGMIPTYESGMALIPLLRDKSAMVRATACESAATIRAKHCEEYIKKLAFTETDPNVKQVAMKAFDQLRDKVA